MLDRSATTELRTPLASGDRFRLLLLSPVFNESEHIERVAHAVAAQTLRPARWIVVDDGSTDRTLEILHRLRHDIPFLEVVTKPSDGNPRDRLAAALEARAFNRGLAGAGDLREYTHIGKLDGDIELPSAYFEELAVRFAADPLLGLSGGALIEPHGQRWRTLVTPDYHVHGAMKVYTRDCFERIGGMSERLAWDTIDETYARMAGLTTRSHKDLVARHLRPAASADGQLRGRARHGECAWILHYSVPWILIRSLKVALEPPALLSAFAFLYGYFAAAVKRVQRVPDRDFREFTRGELRARLRRTVTEWFVGLPQRRLRSARP